MKTICKFLKWPNFLHGKGHYFYESKEAKELFAKQLISLSEKVFWFMFLPIFGFLVEAETFDLSRASIASIVMLSAGLYLRHQGLRIIDAINTKKIPSSTPDESS